MRTALLLLPLMFQFLAAACAAPGLPDDGLGAVDGDTVVIDLAGSSESVRLLGIDTPETVHPGRSPECFGNQASVRMAELLLAGTSVIVTRDVEARDRYGRLLAYVARVGDGLVVNRAMVAEGFAATLHIDPNDGMRHELAAAETRALADRRGLWAACGGPHEPLSIG